MPTQTTNYGLAKPGVEEFYDVEVQNGNMDKIDAEMKRSEKVANKGQPGGYPELDSKGKVPTNQLPDLGTNASSVEIVDEGSYFNSDKVEGALQEIGYTLNGVQGALVKRVNAVLRN